jgi:YidC/Oxa1 family membrane protein insertase
VLGSLDSLVSLVGFVVAPLISVPLWDQYVDLLEAALNFLANLMRSAGLAVVVFTIIVKTVLVPLTVQSLRSSKAMQELQPKIKELQKKYGKDRQRLSQATMQLYSEHRVNPMAGCLPMLIQIPIFFGLYRAIVNLSNSDTGYWAGSFLWLQSLADADPYKILPITAGVFQFIQTKMMRPVNQGKITDPQQAMMNQMMNFMPLMVIIFGWTFASGPVIYWATQSLFSVVQQWFITGWGSMRDWMPSLPELPEHRRLGYRPPRSLDDVVVMSGDDDGAVPQQSGVMGWMQRRMEEANRQAQAKAAASGAPSGTGSGGGSRSNGGRRSGTGTSTKTKTMQARVDAATEPERTEPARRATGGSRRARSRPARPADGVVARGNGATPTSTANATKPANAANGQPNETDGATRQVVVPRKTRPVRKRADSGAAE